MSFAQWVGIGGGLALLAVIVFAFRQGTKVPSREGHDNWPPDARGPGESTD